MKLDTGSILVVSGQLAIDNFAASPPDSRIEAACEMLFCNCKAPIELTRVFVILVG